MNNFKFAQIFKTKEKEAEKTEKELRVKRVAQMLEEEFSQSLLKTMPITNKQQSQEMKLTRKYNELMYANAKKMKEIGRLKEIVDNLNRKNVENEISRKKADVTLVEYQSTLNSKHGVTEAEKEGFIEKLKAEICKISAKHEDEILETEQLVYARGKLRDVIIGIRKHVWMTQNQCENTCKYENRALIVQRIADNEKIRTEFDNLIKKGNIHSERRYRSDTLEVMSIKDELLKENNEKMALQYAENHIMVEDHREKRTYLSNDFKDSIIDHNEVKVMRKNIENKLKEYKEVFDSVIK